ncbi:MAG: FUN14 domain-containing protein [Thermofilaceae archaeon]
MTAIEALAVQALTGFTIGAFIGYAVRKAVGFVATLVGVYLLSLMALSSLGAITIHWQTLYSLLQQLLQWLGVATSTATEMLLSSTPLTLSFVVGMAFGLGFLHTVNPPSRHFVKRRVRKHVE